MYDVIVIGAGPAGLTASIYASCYNLSHLVIGRILGGQLTLAPHIVNYPGFNQGISGKELLERMVDQVKKLGGDIVSDEVVNIKKGESERQSHWIITTRSGISYESRALILATGTERRKLNVPGENEYAGRGVYYCATCEPEAYTDQEVAIVGGGNSALQAVVQIAPKAKHITLIYRGRELRADPYLLEEANKASHVDILYERTISMINGDGQHVTSVNLITVQEQNSQPVTDPSPPKISRLSQVTQSDGKMARELPVDAVFIEIGGVPGAALVAEVGVNLTPHGYIVVDHRLQTNIPNIFAAGDIVGDELSMEQITTAVGLGARAAASCYYSLKAQHAPVVWGKTQIRR